MKNTNGWAAEDGGTSEETQDSSCHSRHELFHLYEPPQNKRPGPLSQRMFLRLTPFPTHAGMDGLITDNATPDPDALGMLEFQTAVRADRIEAVDLGLQTLLKQDAGPFPAFRKGFLLDALQGCQKMGGSRREGRKASGWWASCSSQ